MKKINFSELKNKKVRAIVFTNEKGNPELVRGNENIELVKENEEFLVEIYNPSHEQREEIAKYILEKIQKGEKETSGKEVILKFVPMLTNIDFDLDEEKDNVLIEEIVNDPSDILRLVSTEISYILEFYTERVVNTILDTQNKFNELINKLNDMDSALSDEERLKVLENVIGTLTETLNIEDEK